jgi:hypothetical protein
MRRTGVEGLEGCWGRILQLGRLLEEVRSPWRRMGGLEESLEVVVGERVLLRRDVFWSCSSFSFSQGFPLYQLNMKREA